MQIPIHVLSLSRAHDRRASISRRLTALGLGYFLVDAPDYLNIPIRTLEARFGRAVGKGFSPATPGDMACTLGHLNIWHEIARGRASAAMVLEDDASFDEALRDWSRPDIVGMMERHGSHLLRLETRSGENIVGRRLGDGIWRLTSAAFGSAGYIVTRRGAGRLLQLADPPLRPADHLLWGPISPVRSALRPIVLHPGIICQDVANFPSLIAAERDRLNTRRPTLRDSVGRIATRLAVLSHRAEPIAEPCGTSPPKAGTNPEQAFNAGT